MCMILFLTKCALFYYTGLLFISSKILVPFDFVKTLTYDSRSLRHWLCGLIGFVSFVLLAELALSYFVLLHLEMYVKQ